MSDTVLIALGTAAITAAGTVLASALEAWIKRQKPPSKNKRK